MATLRNSKLTIFEPCKQEFEEGQLLSDNEPERSRTLSPDHITSRAKEPYKSLDGNFSCKIAEPYKTSNSANSSTSWNTLPPKNEKRTHGRPSKFNHRSSKNSRCSKAEKRSYERSPPPYAHAHNYYGDYHRKPHYYGSNHASEISAEKLKSGYQSHVEAPQVNYPPFDPNLNYYGYPQTFMPPYDYRGTCPQAPHPYQGSPSHPFDGESRVHPQFQGAQNKYYNPKQKQKSQGSLKMAEEGASNFREIISQFERYFCGKQWDQLLVILQGLLDQNNNSIQQLSKFLERWQGRPKIKKTLKVFSILKALNLITAMDELIERERTARRQRCSSDRIQALLKKLTRPVPLSR